MYEATNINVVSRQILFWFEILSWNIRYSNMYLREEILLRIGMQMLEGNFSREVQKSKLHIFGGKEKNDVTQVKKPSVIYGVELYKFKL
jgi:hypothetical protein